MRRGLLLILCLLLVACATGKSDSTKLDRTLYMYASAVRWNNFQEAADFIDPALRPRLAPSELQLQRYAQIQVTGYAVQGKEMVSADELRQNVELRLVNRHTQVERSVVDR